MADSKPHSINGDSLTLGKIASYLGDGSRNARSLSGHAAAGARGRAALERRHGLRDAAGQGELLAELHVGAALGCKGGREKRLFEVVKEGERSTRNVKVQKTVNEVRNKKVTKHMNV